MKEIYRLLRKMGITSKYKGYYFVAEAIHMAMELTESPLKITKDIYPDLARKFKSKPMNVEHNIRTVVSICWEDYREEFREIAGYRVDEKPTNSEFVEIMAYYLSGLGRKKNAV